jgi:hypothetical protein
MIATGTTHKTINFCSGRDRSEPQRGRTMQVSCVATWGKLLQVLQSWLTLGGRPIQMQFYA